MIQKYEGTGVTWIDLLTPSPEEVRAIMEECNIPPELLGDLTTPVPRSEGTASGNTIKINIDFPVVKQKEIERTHEIKFLISQKTLITVRYEEITALHTFGKEFEVLSTLKRATKGVSGATLFIALMGTLYDSLASKLDYTESRLAFIEQEMFEEREREMVFEISRLSQTLITFKQILFSHKEVLELVQPKFITIFGDEFESHLSDLATYYQFLTRRVSTLTDSLHELRDTNNSLLSTKQNETMKVLTIMAFVTYPLTLISSVFGMNTEHTPFVGGAYGFWIIIGIMAAAASLLFIYFKHKNWL